MVVELKCEVVSDGDGLSESMDSLEKLLRPTGHTLASITAAAIGRKGRHLTGTFCLTGDTMEGIIQCLVFLKAFSVSISAEQFGDTFR